MLDHFIRAEQRHELVSLAVEWLQTGKRVAMVTLVNVEGNSPYPTGSQMLVAETGDYQGQISGGCAEKAIADHAVSVIKFGENRVQRYGLHSPYFDVTLPCGSGIDVFIDVTTSLSEYQSIHSSLMARTVHSQTLKTSEIQFSKDYLPNPRLILLGQGPILMQASLIGLAAGFDVLPVSQNQDTLTMLNSSGLDGLLLDQCPDIESIIDVFTGLVSLFHEHDFELDILSKALNTNAFYIGALGSKGTHASRLESLRLMGVDEISLLRINGPVGVNIKANTPAQIAISIIAQAVDELNCHTTQHEAA